MTTAEDLNQLQPSDNLLHVQEVILSSVRSHFDGCFMLLSLLHIGLMGTNDNQGGVHLEIQGARSECKG
jgi:hypothetical protein